MKGSWVRCSQGQHSFLHGRREDGHRVEGWSQLLSSIHNYLAGVGKPGREQRAETTNLEDSVSVPTKKQLLSHLQLGLHTNPPAESDRAGLIKGGEEGRGEDESS